MATKPREIRQLRRATQAGEGGWRKHSRQKPKVDFKLRKVEQHGEAKAQLEVRPIKPVAAPGTFDERGRVQVSIEDLRDDTISIIRNSHKTFDQIRADGGPCASTLTKWLERQTQRPQLNTIRAALLACDHDFYILPKGRRTPK
jgi:hypothetical protein